MGRLAVLVSGAGTLLEAILQNQLTKGLTKLVIADQECPGLEIAQKNGVATELISRHDFGKPFDRLGFTRRIKAILVSYDIDVVAMAGFMTILDSTIFEGRFNRRILNIHPSLLPAFPGAHAVRDALEYGALQTGYTIHIATGRVDDARGGIIDQQTVPVLPEDDEDSLHERIKVLERLAYPQKFGDSWTNGI